MVKAWFQDKEWLAVAKKALGPESTIVSGELTISASDQHHKDQRPVMKRVKWPGSQTDPFFGRTIPHLGPSDISDWGGSCRPEIHSSDVRSTSEELSDVQLEAPGADTIATNDSFVGTWDSRDLHKCIDGGGC